ncbi:hypothetical protein QI633_11080 [Nocardioides sp. QY071]|uniref:hypothetical protein n=1 Tax=Nocardioides sp. QY071 TaxID=3044187 RepID=UPI00249AE711|nr:hypothetical protein [Nocardioides sp. QY071]WGY04289.1 hypothetical protein QI633_11080 [Nocardioides sp. QY071]
MEQDEEHRAQLDRLRFVQAVAEHATQVVALITRARSVDEAVVAVSRLLDVDEVTVMSGLAQFNLLALTRPATERRAALLAEGS